MRLTWLLVLFLVVTAVFAKDRSKKKDKNRGNKRANRGRNDDVLNAREVETDEEDGEYGTVEVQAAKDKQPQEGLRNPCNTKGCKRGEVCVLEDDKKAVCVCQTCEVPDENESKVCSRHNATYNTECHLDRDHCLCKNKQPGCSDSGRSYIRLDYYSACKELTECPDDEFDSFPLRMRDWLFRIMTTLAYRQELDGDYLDMTELAMNDRNHADAVIWKFCDLDKDPEDRHVTRRELMYIIASVKPMEHCLVPFLNSCDENDDNTITLVEWGTCLNIGHEAIQDKCHH